MKKIYLTILVILLVGSAIAGTGSLLNKKITIPNPEINSTRIQGNITFDIGKETYSCYVDEPDGIIDEGDIISCAKDLGIPAGTELENICDWNNECLEEGKGIIGDYPDLLVNVTEGDSN